MISILITFCSLFLLLIFLVLLSIRKTLYEIKIINIETAAGTQSLVNIEVEKSAEIIDSIRKRK